MLAAGCDIALHCSGVMEEMAAVAGAVGEIEPEAKLRLDRAMATVEGRRSTETLEALIAKRDTLLAYA